MTRRLLLIRHAEAAFMGPDGTDHGRPLAPYGVQQAERIGRLIADGTLPAPQLVYRSDAARAVQTWDAAAGTAGSLAEVQDLEDLYSTSMTSLADVVRDTAPHVEAIALVGHAPEVPAMARSLNDGAVLVQGWPPATVGVVEIDGPWSEFPEGARLVGVQEIEA